jgi:FkbM family methyltransferase
VPDLGVSLAEWLGLVRSLVVYWRPGRRKGLCRLYGAFVKPGDLVFDVGAHLGDRSAAFAALGARVVALEPQPHIVSWLRRLVGRNERITVRAEAVGPRSGTAMLALSLRTPTVSTLAETWRRKLPGTNPGFRRVRWESATEVPVTTLDALIDIHGVPSFCKIDVEGYESEVLAGLSRPIPALSLEFVSGGLEVAVASVHRLDELGTYEYNAIRGEEREFALDIWVSSGEILDWLDRGAGGAASGDIYARRARDQASRFPRPVRAHAARFSTSA